MQLILNPCVLVSKRANRGNLFERSDGARVNVETSQVCAVNRDVLGLVTKDRQGE